MGDEQIWPTRSAWVLVYVAQKCSVCHAVAGVGNKPGIVGHRRVQAVGRRDPSMDRQRARNGGEDQPARKPVMKAYPNIPKADLDTLVAYIASLEK